MKKKALAVLAVAAVLGLAGCSNSAETGAPVATPTAAVEPTETSAPEPTEESTPTPEPTETSAPEPTEESTPTPEPTSTPEPTPTPTSTPTPEPTSTPEPTPTPTSTPTPTPTSTPTPEPTNTPTPEPTSTPTPEPTNTPTPKPTNTPTPKPTKAPEPTNTPTPKPTKAPKATPTPEPTEAPDDDDSDEYFTVSSMSLGKEIRFKKEGFTGEGGSVAYLYLKEEGEYPYYRVTYQGFRYVEESQVPYMNLSNDDTHTYNDKRVFYRLETYYDEDGNVKNYVFRKIQQEIGDGLWVTMDIFNYGYSGEDPITILEKCLIDEWEYIE